MQVQSNSLTRVATLLSALTVLCLVAIPLCLLWALLFPTEWLASRLSGYPDTPQPEVLSFPSLFGLGLVDLAGLILVAVILVTLLRLLNLYRRGFVLDAENARHILRLGQALIALAAFQTVAHTLDVMAITWSNPPGMRHLQIDLSSNMVALLLAGGLMTLIGWAMQQAAAIADDHAAII